MAKVDSKNFSKAELDKILKAFYDIADAIDTNDFVNETGVTDASSPFGSADASKTNFAAARNLIYRN
jgi:hypothetical protein